MKSVKIEIILGSTESESQLYYEDFDNVLTKELIVKLNIFMQQVCFNEFEMKEINKGLEK